MDVLLLILCLPLPQQWDNGLWGGDDRGNQGPREPHTLPLVHRLEEEEGTLCDGHPPVHILLLLLPYLSHWLRLDCGLL